MAEVIKSEMIAQRIVDVMQRFGVTMVGKKSRCW